MALNHFFAFLFAGEWSVSWDDGAVALGNRYVEVSLDTSLGDILSHPDMVVPGFPVFHVFVRDCDYTRKFLEGRV